MGHARPTASAAAVGLAAGYVWACDPGQPSATLQQSLPLPPGWPPLSRPRLKRRPPTLDSSQRQHRNSSSNQQASTQPSQRISHSHPHHHPSSPSPLLPLYTDDPLRGSWLFILPGALSCVANNVLWQLTGHSESVFVDLEVQSTRCVVRGAPEFDVGQTLQVSPRQDFP
ncbi:hypothetical protein F5884DRAFT_743961 [Xylogone sp. PMI_703]|nr:hypothetical protein F5884DRAFT_743961 [Xylogone sp. PMI_703]